MIIIPAIDIIDGQCVRLSQGDYNKKKVYHARPLAVAKEFEAAGIDHLHLVDLDGAKAGGIRNLDVLAEITTHTNLKVDFGGGVKSDDDIANAFTAGASQITCGSIAVNNPKKVADWIKQYGADQLILGADVKAEKIAIHGWAETSNQTVYDLINQYIQLGINHVICTDIATDGMLAGPGMRLYEKILQRYPSIKLIASGGVSSMSDLYALRNVGCYGAIVGKAIYENKVTLEELNQFNNA